MVDSPTPTVPIASDSTRRMRKPVSRKRASAAAVIHPAVPPQAISMVIGSWPPITSPYKTAAAPERQRRSRRRRLEFVRDAKVEITAVALIVDDLASIAVLIRDEGPVG